MHPVPVGAAVEGFGSVAHFQVVLLGFVAALGPCLLAAFGPTAMLKLPEAPPETLVVAMPGREIGALVDHPLFAGRGWRIVRVERDPADGLPVIHFRVPLVPFAMPWASGPEGAS